ncbi:hypothetical protein QFC20_007624 [Naganishia adeliensis]|uniref:Uncharacterized protein n=1 Tax=Naganishia adeliensis TaxID=92952 RepID=A0ACC2UXN4_9TREE|nr:hypothetical protein QFC20_007624 [Naganishia adeliensis]
MSSSGSTTFRPPYHLHPPMTPMHGGDLEWDGRQGTLTKYKLHILEELPKLMSQIFALVKPMRARATTGQADDSLALQEDQEALKGPYIQATKLVIALAANHTWINSENVRPKERNVSFKVHQARLLNELKEEFEDHRSLLGLPCSWDELLHSQELKEWQSDAWKLAIEMWAQDRLGLEVSEVRNISISEAKDNGTLTLTRTTADCRAILRDDDSGLETQSELQVTTDGRITWLNTREDWTMRFQGSKDKPTPNPVSLHGSLQSYLDLEASEWIPVDVLSQESPSAETAKGKGKGPE